MVARPLPARQIAVPLGPRTTPEAERLLADVGTRADLVELRLDLFETDYDLRALLDARRVPVVVTLRAADEGGRSTASARERLAVLVRAAEQGAEYVDVETRWFGARDVATLRSAGAAVIVSRHAFASMPPEMEGAWWQEALECEPDVVKLVGMASTPSDALRALALLRKADRPTIAIAMGEAGMASRILCLRDSRCFLTFAAWGEASTAPGQVSLDDMDRVYRVRRIGPETRAFGLLGSRVERERLAAYNAWFDGAGVDAVAVPFPAGAEAAAVVGAARGGIVAGWHVHGLRLQTEALRACDRVSDAARRQAKANALVERNGEIEGHWVASPEEQFALWTGREVPSDSGLRRYGG